MSRFKTLFSLLFVLLSHSAWAKPFYVTVPRTFGTQESPVIELAFTSNAPIEMRVLKPIKLDDFINSQLNMRRAYVQPVVHINPAFHLAHGLSQVANPARALLSAIDIDLRKKLAFAVPYDKQKTHTEIGQQSVVALEKGDQAYVDLPSGFEMVRSEWLNLDRGGAGRDFNVPGMDVEEDYSYHPFQERLLSIEPLPAGIYVLQFVQNKLEGQVTLVVTDLAVQVKQSDGKALIRVANRAQKPVKEALVKLWQSDKRLLTAKTNAEGEAIVETHDSKLMAVVQLGSDTALVDTDFYTTLSVTPDVFIYSDRPIYKPGDDIQFRGLVRKPSSYLASLFKLGRDQVEISLESDVIKATSLKNENSSAAAASKVLATVDEYGAFHGQIHVPQEASAGVVRLKASLDQRTYQSEARVQNYVKPTFYVEIAAADSLQPGQKLKATLKALRYTGAVPSKVFYEYFLYRVLVDAPAWIDDAGKGATGSQVTYGGASTHEGKLSLPERLYSSFSARSIDDDKDPWESAATFNAQGKAEISIDVPPISDEERKLPYKYVLSIRSRDDQKSEALASKTFFLSETEVLGQLNPSTALAIQGTEASLSIRAVSLSGQPYGACEGTLRWVVDPAGGQEKELKSLHFKTDHDGIYRLPFPTEAVGKVRAEVTLKDKTGHDWRGITSILVAAKNPTQAVLDTPTLLVQALKSQVDPDQKAQLIALFPEGWGEEKSNHGSVWLTLSGAEIYQTERLNFSGRTLIHSFALDKRFGSTVYASLTYVTPQGRFEERTVAYRIVPQERLLTLAITPQKREAAPLSEQTIRIRATNAQGDGVPVQLSLGVVDKALYAIQNEFRPTILDFFYPLVRNNVANFYSSDFQGYGYGEAVAFNQARDYLSHFAAIKPPTREPKAKERDTAYWNSKILTDANGYAEISFTLPSNQTTWVASVVASDAAGRFGEAQSEFLSRGSFTLQAALPPFLYEGDELKAWIRFSSVTPASMNLRAQSSGGFKASDQSIKLTTTVQSEQLIPLSLQAEHAGLATLEMSITGAAKGSLQDLRTLEIKPAMTEELVRVTTQGGGELKLPIQPGRLRGAAELILMPSSIDVALQSLRELLSYPYGCTEQLVATTVPDIAIYQTLTKAKTFTQLDTEHQTLLTEAQSRAIQGIGRILQMATTGGGFGWFNGESTASLPMTLIALDGLSYAVNAQLLSAQEPKILQALHWAESQQDLDITTQAYRAYIIARLRHQQAAPLIRKLLENLEDDNDVYSLSLLVLAAQEAKITEEHAVQKHILTLYNQTQGDWTNRINNYYNTHHELFWNYPLRQVGLGAILLHAASLVKQSPEKILEKQRKLFISAMTEGNLSTLDKSSLLLHSLEVINQDIKQLKRSPAPKIEIPGNKNSFTFKPYGFGFSIKLPNQATQVKISSFQGTALLQGHKLTPLKESSAQSQGLSLTRQYYLVRDHQLKLLTENDSVYIGDDIYVSFNFNADQSNEMQRSAYYVLKDSLPAGFSAIQEDKVYRAAPYSLNLFTETLKKRVFNQESTHFFFESPAPWSEEPQSIGYIMRALYAGKFKAPPAMINDMYTWNINAKTPGFTLNVIQK